MKTTSFGGDESVYSSIPMPTPSPIPISTTRAPVTSSSQSYSSPYTFASSSLSSSSSSSESSSEIPIPTSAPTPTNDTKHCPVPKRSFSTTSVDNVIITSDLGSSCFGGTLHFSKPRTGNWWIIKDSHSQQHTTASNHRHFKITLPRVSKIFDWSKAYNAPILNNVPIPECHCTK